MKNNKYLSSIIGSILIVLGTLKLMGPKLAIIAGGGLASLIIAHFSGTYLYDVFMKWRNKQR